MGAGVGAGVGLGPGQRVGAGVGSGLGQGVGLRVRAQVGAVGSAGAPHAAQVSKGEDTLPAVHSSTGASSLWVTVLGYNVQCPWFSCNIL